MARKHLITLGIGASPGYVGPFILVGLGVTFREAVVVAPPIGMVFGRRVTGAPVSGCYAPKLPQATVGGALGLAALPAAALGGHAGPRRPQATVGGHRGVRENG
jgi:hypothetical protein